MPIAPSTYLSNIPLSAGQLNQDMYSYDGTYFAAQGVMFHANRPICHESYTLDNTVGTNPVGTAWVAFGGVIGDGLSIVDTSALYGVGCDFPGAQATYRSQGVTAPGSSGIAGSRGGWTLMAAFVTMGGFSGTPCSMGAGWSFVGASNQHAGVIQQGNTAHVNCSFVVDLININNLSSALCSTVLGVDPNSTKGVIASNTAPNSVGQTPRFEQIWMTTNQGTHGTVSTIPGTIANFTTTTSITNTLLNNSIQQSLTLLNYPPSLQVTAGLSQTIPTSTVTKVQYGSAQTLDNYLGWSGTNHQYIVPLTGVYFCHSNIVFGIGATSGTFQCGFTVNGTNYNGPNYPAANTNGKIQTATAVTRMLDLNAGDTISTFAFNTESGGVSLSNVYYSRMVVCWMASITNSGLTYTAPDVTGFLWQAGTSPGTASGQLVPLFNSKIANDLNFLVQRPYLLSYQATAQTSLANTQWTPATMDTVKGLVHGSQGDNYGGWSSANHNYVAQVSGWYLAVSEVSISTTSTSATAGTLVAGIYCPVSGGHTAPSFAQGPPDWYQEMVPAQSGGPSAATSVGMYYLLAGETIQPQIQWINASGTFNTSVTSFNSTFSLVWLAE